MQSSSIIRSHNNTHDITVTQGVLSDYQQHLFTKNGTFVLLTQQMCMELLT
jgi:hypothetical protein